MIIISISYGRKLFNLAKIYINKEKYSDYNNSFIFKLAIFNYICLRTNVLFDIKIKTFSTML